MFRKLEGDTALLRQGGVFKPCSLYSFQGGIYAQLGGGYVRLRKDGTTSKNGVDFTYLEYDGLLYADRFGRLSCTDGDGYKQLRAADSGEGHPILQLTDQGEDK